MNEIKSLKDPKSNRENFAWTKMDSDELPIQVLKEVGIEKQKGNSIGRRGIFRKLTEHGILTSENEIRRAVNELKNSRLIIVKNGRAGCDITQAGIDYLNGELS